MKGDDEQYKNEIKSLLPCSVPFFFLIIQNLKKEHFFHISHVLYTTEYKIKLNTTTSILSILAKVQHEWILQTTPCTTFTYTCTYQQSDPWRWSLPDQYPSSFQCDRYTGVLQLFVVCLAVLCNEQVQQDHSNHKQEQEVNDDTQPPEGGEVEQWAVSTAIIP